MTLRVRAAALLLCIVAAWTGSAPPAGAQAASDDKYARVVVAPIELAPGVVLPVEYRETLVTRLLEELHKAKVFVQVAEQGPGVDTGTAPLLVLTITVTHFDPGDRYVRHTIGLGAGAANMVLRARFTDPRTCTTVFEAEASDKVWAGWLGGDAIGVTKGTAKEVAQIAKRMDRTVGSRAAVGCANVDAIVAAAPAARAAPSALAALASDPAAGRAAAAPSPDAPPSDFESRVVAAFGEMGPECVPGLERQAAAGDEEAQLMLGLAFVQGRHLTKDAAKGLALLRQAGDQGYRPAQVALCEFNRTGNLIRQDFAKAFTWCSAAAEQGSPEAQVQLALIYVEGLGRPKDPRAGAEWMAKAAAQGEKEALRSLARFYESGTGVPKSEVEAAKWFVRAAEAGDAEAQAELGVRYTLGRGVPVDDAAAVGWELKAAAQGNADAMVYLGVRHETGRGVARDPAQSVRYFGQAADLGHSVAMCYLGDMYFLGRGVGQSAREAYRWHFTSIAAGYPKCEANLRVVAQRLSKAERQAAERDAKAWGAAFEARTRQGGPQPPK